MANTTPTGGNNDRNSLHRTTSFIAGNYSRNDHLSTRQGSTLRTTSTRGLSTSSDALRNNNVLRRHMGRVSASERQNNETLNSHSERTSAPTVSITGNALRRPIQNTQHTVNPTPQHTEQSQSEQEQSSHSAQQGLQTSVVNNTIHHQIRNDVLHSQVANSLRTGRVSRGRVSKDGFARASADLVKEFGSKAEAVAFHQQDGTDATALVSLSLTASHTALRSAQVFYKGSLSAYYGTGRALRKTYRVAKGTARGAVNTVRFAANRTYRGEVIGIAKFRVANSRPITATRNIVQSIENGVQRTGNVFRITKGVMTGRGTAYISGHSIDFATQRAQAVRYINTAFIKSVKDGAKNTGKVGGKALIKIAKGTPTALYKSAMAVGAVGGVLASSNNEMLQATGTAMQGAKVGAMTIKTAAKGVKTTANATVKTVEGTKKGVRNVRTAASYVKRNGLKKSAKTATRKAAQKAGEAIKDGVVKLITSLGKGALIPLAIIVVCVVVINSVITTAASSTTVIFGNWTDKTTKTTDSEGKEVIKREEVDEEDFLITKLKESKKKLREEVKDLMDKDLVKNGGEFHEIRFYNGFTDTEIPLESSKIAENDAAIDRTMFSDTEYYEIIQPIFHTILLSKYDLSPTEEQMNEVYNDIIEDMITLHSAHTKGEEDENSWIEFCGDTEHYPNGTLESEAKDAHTDCHIDHNSGCNRELAMDNCLNMETCFHSNDEFVNGGGCEICCYDYYTCVGHPDELKCTIDEHGHDGWSFSEAQDWYRNNIDGCWDGFLFHDWMVYNIHTVGNKTHFTVTCCHEGCGQDCTGHTHEPWVNKDDTGCYTTKYHCDAYDPNIYSKSNPRVEIKGFICENAEHHSKCRGYKYCKGHKIEKIYLKAADKNKLIDKYFDNDINELKAKDEKDLTDDEKVKLKQLEEWREVAVEAIEILREKVGDEDKVYDEKTFKDLKWESAEAKKAYDAIGTKYAYGGNDLEDTAQHEKGVDDVGLVCNVYDLEEMHDYKSIMESCTLYEYSEVKQGDIIFYAYDDTEDSVYHVGIALGNGFMVHCANSGDPPIGGVKVSKVYKEAVYKVGRIN